MPDIHVLAFARARELLGAGERSVTVPSGARIEDVWHVLSGDTSSAGELRVTLRVARNGRIASFDERVDDGDEVAFLPPVGGG